MALRFNTIMRALLAGNSTPSVPSFYFNFSNPQNVTLGAAQARGNIISTQNAHITMSASLSRVVGVAPMYVNIDMTGTTSDLTANATHDLFYSVNWGDSGAGQWANGVQSAGLTDKNWSFGPVGGHVLETPGTYLVTPTVTDGVNTVSKPGYVTVLDPNVVYDPAYGAGYETICISNSNNFTGAPGTGALPGVATYINRSGDTDMYAALNTYKGSNKRILFCKADSWTCSASNTFTGIAGMTISGYGAGAARTAVFNASASDTLVSVTPSSISGSVFNFETGNSDIRIHNFKITSNSTTKASALNRNITGILLSKIEIRGASSGFSAYPGGGAGVYIEHDQHCMYECMVDELDAASAGGSLSAFVGLVRGGVMGCYFDNGNRAEQTVRIPFIDRGHINNNYIARPNKTKNILKIHSFVYADMPKYSEKFVVSANVLDLRGGYSWNGTTVTEVGDTAMIIGNGGVSGNERVRNCIVENNFTQGCLGNPKDQVFAKIGCPNVTIRNNIADFSVGDRSSAYTGSYGYVSMNFVNVYTSTPDPTVDVRIYNNTLYSNLYNPDVASFVRFSSAATSVVIKNNLWYLNGINPGIASNLKSAYHENVGGYAVTPSVSNNTDAVSAAANTPSFVATPPVALTDWRPGTGSYAINSGTTLPVLRDFNNVTRVGAGNHLGAVLP